MHRNPSNPKTRSGPRCCWGWSCRRSPRFERGLAHASFGGNKELEVIGLHGDKLDTSEVRVLVVKVVRSVQSSRGVSIERIEQVLDDRASFIGTSDTGLVRAAATASYRAVLMHVQETGRCRWG